MKTPLLIALLAVIVLFSMTAWAQMTPRTDAIWARITTDPITLDGKLTEPAWAVAESLNVHYGVNSGMPGGGWTIEDQTHPPSDPTDATIKFLAKDESLYVAIICRDKSIGAGLFNAFDGFLMNVRYRQAPTGQTQPYGWETDQSVEIFYAWCKETWADTTTAFVGANPAFLGQWGNPYIPRPDSLKLYWDAATTVQGLTNDDSTPDTSWTTEFKINASRFGYDIAGPNGDIVMWSVDIYDGDWEWPLDTANVSHNHVWVQDPWSNTAMYDHMRIWVRPDVTTLSGAVPTIPPDLTIPQSTYPAPAMDGTLNAAVWKNPNIGTLQIQYNNTALRNGYPYTAKWRSGQAASTVNGSNTQAVIDPNLVTVKYFFMADTLFLGFDVQDKVVQAYTPQMDPSNWQSRADGIRVTITDRQATDNGSPPYHTLVARLLTFVVDTNGQAYRAEDLEQKAGVWDSSGQAVQVALALRGETKLDTLGRTTADNGYTAEMKIVLTKLGYPAGRGDGVVFLGIDELDGDSFTDPSLSYGNQTWFMKEGTAVSGRAGQNDGPAWCYLDPTVVLGVQSEAKTLPARFALLGNYPNPFNPSTTIKFVMPQASEVTLEVYNVLGQLVRSQSLGVREAGDQTVQFNASTLATGMYAYRLTMASTHSTVVGKMMLLK